MFIDRRELASLCGRRYNLQCLINDPDIGDKSKEVLREELLDVEDEIKIIEKNCLIAR